MPEKKSDPKTAPGLATVRLQSNPADPDLLAVVTEFVRLMDLGGERRAMFASVPVLHNLKNQAADALAKALAPAD